MNVRPAADDACSASRGECGRTPTLSRPVAPRSALVLPWHSHTASADERAALESIQRFGAGIELIVVAPSEALLPPIVTSDRVERFPAANFRNGRSYNLMMVSPSFYERFAAYEQIVVIQSDVLLLKPLAPLLQSSYPWSYVGAPWMTCMADGSVQPWGVGNGGFSLRRVREHLDVLNGCRFPPWPRLRLASRIRQSGMWAGLAAAALARQRGASLARLLIGWGLQEDMFWSRLAPNLSPLYRVAPVQAGLAFAYEQEPRAAHRENGLRLPYGVHAWQRHDPDFVRSLAGLQRPPASTDGQGCCTGRAPS